MNYEKIHNQIIERAKNRKIEGYTERHHILPRCMGGDNSPKNLVNLTAKEHFVVHKLLAEMYPNNYKIRYAVFLMCKMKNVKGRDYIVSSSEYQRIKENIILSDDHRKSISKSLIGNKRNLGKVQSDEHKKKISNTMKGRIRTQEHRKNQSKSVMQYDLNGNFIKEYNSIREAGNILNLFPSNISAVLAGKSSNCGGFAWKYKK
jgi:hypothetical protein